VKKKKEIEREGKKKKRTGTTLLKSNQLKVSD